MQIKITLGDEEVAALAIVISEWQAGVRKLCVNKILSNEHESAKALMFANQLATEVGKAIARHLDDKADPPRVQIS